MEQANKKINERKKSPDSAAKRKQDLVTFENDQASGKLETSLEEISYRLLQILKKLLSQNESVDRFTGVKRPNLSAFENVKDIIFEISSKVDES